MIAKNIITSCIKCGSLVEYDIGDILCCTKCGFKYEFINVDEQMKYKSFGEQIKACKNSSVIKDENCPICGHVLLMCTKYGGQCMSSKCKHERVEI